MPTYFNINYELSIPAVHRRIDERLGQDGAAYLCVADGNVLQQVHRDPAYRLVVGGSLFSICDSSWVPLYLRWIYGVKGQQYCGSQIFDDILRTRRYRMLFLGASDDVLAALKTRLAAQYNPRIAHMTFLSLPFCDVHEFDYPGIAATINADRPDIIWLALGAPKQEVFASRLVPHLHHGIVIPVGAVFKFYSGVGQHRAPAWVVRARLEWLYRILGEPRKQLTRCWDILRTTPAILYHAWRHRSVDR